MVNRGELWWADLGEPIKSEPGYRRPILIIQADAFNKSNIRTVVCAVITSNLKLAEAPGNFLLKSQSTGLSKDSVVNVSQIITVDKSFLTEKIGDLSNKQLQNLEEGLKLILSLR